MPSSLKPSRFNAFLQRDGRYYWYNSATSAVLALGGEAHARMRAYLKELEETGRCSSAAATDLLVESGFAVLRATDERRELHERYVAVRSRAEWARLCVVPTLECNLACRYCFQRSLDRTGVMGHDVAQRLVELAREMLNRASCGLSVTWFGGEPLLAIDTIAWLTDQFIDLCRMQRKRYHAEMISNGSLIPRVGLTRLAALSLSRLELSLDGSAATHADRKGASLETSLDLYRLILDHTRDVVNSVGSLLVRINVDRDNLDEAAEVVDAIDPEALRSGKVDVRLQTLSDHRATSGCIPHACFSAGEAVELKTSFGERLTTLGAPRARLPDPLSALCMASRACSFTVDPRGAVGKCVPAAGTGADVLGVLEPGDDGAVQRLLSYSPDDAFDPFLDRQCGACPFVPVCLGQCPMDHRAGRFVCWRKREIEGLIIAEAKSAT